MKPIIFNLFNNAKLTEKIAKVCDLDVGDLIIHQFPDEETSIKINSNVKDRKIILFASLDRPNQKLLPLIFTAKTVKELGAKEIGLLAPYLAYMRQDKQFYTGEGITSKYFAELLSEYFDYLVTIDPHLHRIKSLDEIYKIPTTVLHTTIPIANWIKKHIKNPLVIGPDKESKQWVSNIATRVNAPFVILEKMRKGDRSVEISFPPIDQFQECVPVLVDDIISTARTMIETILHLKKMKTKPPICIGVHGIFAGNAYQDLLQAGAAKVVTCNSIEHKSNAIDVSEEFIDWINKNMLSKEA